MENEQTFERGSFNHYQEYLKSREPFGETPLTYEQFLESVLADEE